jgi:hypothetical protein
MQLFETTCSTDWKGRPTHGLTLVATGTREELLKTMDDKVRGWQAQDLGFQIEEDIEESVAEGNPHLAEAFRAKLVELRAADAESVGKLWTIEWERWEMLTPNDDKREFASKDGEGGFWSLVYHFVE